MNAYELADELDKYFNDEEYDRLVYEIPDLLRRQADGLNAVEKFIQERGEFGQLIVWLALQEKP